MPKSRQEAEIVTRNFLRFGGLARSTLKVSGWHATRLVTQLVWVIVLARALGAAGYGGFSGLVSLAIVLSGLVGMGLGLRMYQDVARDGNRYALRWSQAWRMTIWTGAGFGLLFVLLGEQLFDGLGTSLFIAIAISELILVPIATQVSFAYAAHGRIERSAAVPVVISIFRVLAALAFFFLAGDFGLEHYVWLHLLATGIAVGLVLVLQQRDLPVTAVPAPIDAADLLSGIGFSAVWASGTALNSIDKAIALRAGGGELAGHYAAAYRFASLLALPVDALMTAVLPRLFRSGAAMSEHSRLIGLLLTVAATYGLGAGGFVWLTADFVPLVLGPDFDPAVPAMRMMAPFVALYCVRIVGVNALLGLGLKRWRFMCEVFALVLLAILGLWWIPIAGLQGAVQALVVSEAVLVALVWPRIWTRQLRKREPKL